MDDKKKKLDELSKKIQETKKSWNKKKSLDLKEKPKEVVKESISKKKDVSEKEIKQSTITKKGNSYYDKDGRLVVKNTEGIYVPYESAVKQVELTQDNRSKQTKKTVKEYDDAIKNPGTLDKLAFLGEQPLNYLEDPTKIIGDLGFNGFPTSKENFESFVKEINNPYKKESSIERALDRTVPKIPAAAFNYALANIGARTPTQALAEAYNPIPGFDIKSTFGKTRNAITSPSIARISGNDFDINMPLNGKNINGIDDASEIYEFANNSKSITKKGKDFLKNSYNKIATGDSPIPFAWKSPAVGLTQEQSYNIYNKIKGGEKLSEAEKVLLAEYQYNSKPFTGRGNWLDKEKQENLNNLIKNNKSLFSNDVVLTRRINPENKELFNIENNKLNLENRPTSFSAGVGIENYGSKANDRIVLSGKNAKQIQNNFLKNNYSEINENTYNNLNNFTNIDDPGFTGKTKIFSNGDKLQPLGDGFVKNLKNTEIEKEIIGTNLNLKRIGKVKNDIGGYDHIMKKFALGGNLQQQNNNNMLTEFNEGGSHESNPNGGILQGQSSNGQMNTVEQGETKKGNFVYSDRLYINEDLAKAMNLPGYIKGKSFASASKAINDKFKDRNDIHTKATQKELLDRLAQSQEQLKAEQEAINRSMQINQSEVEYPEETQQFEGGGFMDFIKNNGGSISDVGGQIGTMINPGGMYQSQLKKANEAGYEDTHLQKNQKYSQTIDGVQGMVGKAFGPVGEAVVGIKRLGENIGGAIGGDVGAGVSSFFSPEKAAIANWTDKDMKFGDKLLGHLPVVGGIKANNSAEKRLKKFQDNKNRANSFYKYQFNENNDDTKVFRKGGFLDGGNPEDTFPNGIYQAPVVTDQEYLLNNKGKYNPNIIKDIQSRIGAFVDGDAGKETYVKSGLRYDGTEFPIRLNADKALESALETPDLEVKPDYTLDDIKNMESSYNATVKNKKKPFDFKQVSDKFGNALRYAPILGNILQKNKIGPAEVESAIKNPYQYKKQYIDEAQYRNAADQQAALSMEALNKSGLSGNQLMAASLGSQLERTKGVAEGAMAAKMHNLNENKIAEQVKQQNEGDYIADVRRINDVNAQNRANRDTQMSKFDAEIYNSLGDIGKEELFKKQAEKLTGYKMMGEYMMADPNYKSQYEAIQKDSKLTPKEKYAMTRNLIKEASSTFDEESYKKVSDALIETSKVGHAYGGYMSPKFNKY